MAFDIMNVHVTVANTEFDPMFDSAPDLINTSMLLANYVGPQILDSNGLLRPGTSDFLLTGNANFILSGQAEKQFQWNWPRENSQLKHGFVFSRDDVPCIGSFTLSAADSDPGVVPASIFSGFSHPIYSVLGLYAKQLGSPRKSSTKVMKLSSF